MNCGYTVRRRPIVTIEHLIGNPTPEIQWYHFEPPSVTPNIASAPPCGILAHFGPFQVVGPLLSLDRRLGIRCRLTSVIRRVVTSLSDVH